MTMRKVSRGKFKKDRAKALYDAAKASIGVTEGRASMFLEIQPIFAAMEASNGFLEEAVVRKLLRIIFAIVRDESVYVDSRASYQLKEAA